MPSFNKFNLFVQDLIDGAVNLSSDTIKVMLTNTAPVATNHYYGDISATELANGNGYTTGGVQSALTLSNASGVETVKAAAVTWNASGPMGPFRYAVFYDATPASNKPLIGWFDYGSSITPNNGESFTVTPDQTNGLFQLQ